MKFSKKTMDVLNDLGVKIDIKNINRMSNRNVSKKSDSTTNTQNKEVKIEKPKNIGQYKVLKEEVQLRDLDNVSLLAGIVFEGDSFDLVDDKFIFIEGELYKKVKIISSWFGAYDNRIAWMPIKETNAPQEIPVKKLLSGEFRILSENLKIRDCNDLEVIGSLSTGDSVDFDEYNESITLKDSVLRKVIVRDSENADLIGKKVWMPILKINDLNKSNLCAIEYKISKDTKLFNSLEDLDGFNLCKGDCFRLTDEPMQFIDGQIFKKVEITSSKTVLLSRKTGWIEIRYSNALITTFKQVENEYRKDLNTSLFSDRLSYKDVVLNRDILAYTPDCISDSNISILEKGTKLRLYDLKDTNNRSYVEIETKGCDGIKRIVQYSIAF